MWKKNPFHDHLQYEPTEFFNSGWITNEDGNTVELFDCRAMRDAFTDRRWEYFECWVNSELKFFFVCYKHYALKSTTPPYNKLTLSCQNKNSPVVWDSAETYVNAVWTPYYDYVVQLFAEGKIKFITPDKIKTCNAKNMIVERDESD